MNSKSNPRGTPTVGGTPAGKSVVMLVLATNPATGTTNRDIIPKETNDTCNSRDTPPVQCMHGIASSMETGMTSESIEKTEVSHAPQVFDKRTEAAGSLAQHPSNKKRMEEAPKWANLFNENKFDSRGMELAYIAPTIIEGRFVVQLQKEELDKENDKWQNALIIYVAGSSPTIAAIERYPSYCETCLQVGHTCPVKKPPEQAAKQQQMNQPKEGKQAPQATTWQKRMEGPAPAPATKPIPVAKHPMTAQTNPQVIFRTPLPEQMRHMVEQSKNTQQQAANTKEIDVFSPVEFPPMQVNQRQQEDGKVANVATM
ncbi:hypothetical protein K7X08_004745 [Anisodus acutangulus]|uniref:Uncharacterized protein n=1 Tax=Anisodus acutangulus TaxID=402998 RepID=A0A9Q1MHR7_9SOLA|nr:hypothetical protein K7X08_004745 [Anisodus acutangulus]